MWQYDWHISQPLDGNILPQGNNRNIFEKRVVPLCFTQPYYSPAVWGPDRVLNEPVRLTKSIAADRGSEALIHGARRFREIRSLRYEDADKIAAANKREDDEYAEKLRRTGGEKVRWWHTSHALSQRDSLKTVKMNNFTFNPERLVSSKEVVILNLTGCKIGDENLVWISTFMQQNHTLRRLILQGNKITAKGVEQLAPGISEAPALIEIDFSFNPIRDEGVANLLVAVGQNIRKIVLSKVGLGCCGLTPDVTYNLVRLMRDLPTMQCLLLWRNNIGLKTEAEMSGIGVLLEELRINKNIRLLDLTGTNINEASLGKFATDLERAAREKRLGEVDHQNRARRIVDMSDEIERRKATAIWDDEKYEIVALEKELEAERAKFQEQLEIEKSERNKKTTFNVWRDKVHEEFGRDLIDVKRRIRIILRNNPGVTPSTLKRLGAFFDVDFEADFNAFIEQKRVYDNIIIPRRQPGEYYEYRTCPEHPTEEEARDWYNPYNFESEYEREKRVARENRRRELEELRKNGYDGAAGDRYHQQQNENNNNNNNNFDDLEQQQQPGSPSSARDKMTTVFSVDVEDEIKPLTVEEYGFGETAKRARRLNGGGHAVISQTTNDGNDMSSPSSPAAAAASAGGGGNAYLNAFAKIDQIMGNIEMATELEANNARTRIARYFEEALGRLRDHLDRGAGGGGGTTGSFLLRLDFGKLKRSIDTAAKKYQELIEEKEKKAAELRSIGADKFQAEIGGSQDVSKVAAAAAAGEDEQEGEKKEKQEGEGEGEGEKKEESDEQQSKDKNDDDAQQQQEQEKTTEPSAVDYTKIDIFKQLYELATSMKRLDHLRNMSMNNPNQPNADAVIKAEDFIDEEKNRITVLLADMPDEQIESHYGPYHLDQPMQQQLLVAMLEEMVKQPEDHPGNLQFAQAILQKFPMGSDAWITNNTFSSGAGGVGVAGQSATWGQLLATRSLLLFAAAQGAVSYFHLFLHFVDEESINNDLDELVTLCINHPVHRMTLTMLLVQKFGSAGAFAFKRNAFQQFLEDASSIRRQLPQEDVSSRYDLVATLLNTPELGLSRSQINQQGSSSSDGMSVFTRACFDGDATLLQTLNINPNAADEVLRNPCSAEMNYVSPLMLAVMSNSYEAVDYLIQTYGADALGMFTMKTKPGNDNALDVAVGVERSPEICDLLRQQGMTCKVDEKMAAASEKKKQREAEDLRKREREDQIMNNPKNMTNKSKGSRAALAKQMAARR